jgi:cobalt-zinc-cadmium efflux system membrane fusion protein
MKRVMLLICMAIPPIAFSGCNQAGDATATATAEDGHGGETAGHDHSGWWCPEHGIPEEVCTRCNSTLIAQFKEKGDWCEEHDRPDSNCFHCHPELEAKFAARYTAKYGEEPPTPTDP